MVNYSDISKAIIPQKSFINFKEYHLDRHERKVITMEIQDMQVAALILPNVALSREQLSIYYGDSLEDTEYLAISSLNYYRVVLQITDPDHPEIGASYKVLSLNQYFMFTGLQVLEVSDHVSPIIASSPGQLLGFSSYQIGGGTENKN